MTDQEEADFTALATKVLEPYCTGAPLQDYADQLTIDSPFLTQNGFSPEKFWLMGVVVDAEMKILAVCPDVDTATVLATLINYACEFRPFHNPADPTAVRIGL